MDAYPQTPRRWQAGWPWGVLAALSLALVAGTATFDRASWPSVMGDEATYLMQAESLAWDRDLSYSLADYRRFVDRRGIPQGLILQSGDRGAHVVYSKPFFYALFLAPFVRLAPVHGPFVANALLLIFTCIRVARALARWIGPLAPLWLVVWVFASVTFGQVFWAHPDLFLACLTALALALVLQPSEGSPSGGRTLARWALAGLLLAVVGYSRPPYLSLFLPALAAVPRGARKLALPALFGGGVAVFLMAGSLHQTLAGSWTSYGAERMGFYRHTGFPEVDFPAAAWEEKIGELGNVAAAAPSEIDWHRRLVPSLWAWNALYFAIGRHVGVLPYFLPLVLGLVAAAPRAGIGGRRRWPIARWDGRTWSLILAVALACGAFLILRPFNFYGGGGTIANRYFLPLYPALWFLVRRPLRLRWLLLVTALAGLFAWPLWLQPRAYPITGERDYRYVSPVAERWLPYETTLSHLKLAGREDLYPGMFVRFLSPELEAGEDGQVRLPAGVDGELLLGSIEPLAAVDVELVDPPGAVPEAFLGDRPAQVLPTAPARFRIRLEDPIARHPMWWSRWQPAHLYRLRLRFDSAGAKAVAFGLSPPPPGEVASGGGD